jgi:hypothetical protein
MLIFRLPPPPKMNREEYRLYRARLAIMIVVWFVLVGICFFFWQGMSTYMKVFIFIVGCIFVPDVTMLEQVITSYKRYEREGT